MKRLELVGESETFCSGKRCQLRSDARFLRKQREAQTHGESCSPSLAARPSPSTALPTSHPPSPSPCPSQRRLRLLEAVLVVVVRVLGYIAR